MSATIQATINSFGFNTLDITLNLLGTNSINEILAFSISKATNENITVDDIQQYIDSMWETKDKYMTFYIDERILTLQHKLNN